MKHGVAFRKFSRTMSHRDLMLRNLVTSLFEHEQIKTTLPKAKDTARLAEKIITLGKRGDRPAYERASAFILDAALLPKIFSTFAERYANRQGGYTRIHKFGHRPGDNAPHAILELVDNPRDLRFNMTARAVGWELLRETLRSERPLSLVNRGIQNVDEFIRKERNAPNDGTLRDKTRWNLQKALKFRGDNAVRDLAKKTVDYIDSLLARPVLMMKALGSELTPEISDSAERSRGSLTGGAGHRLPGEKASALTLAQQALGRPKWRRRSSRTDAGSRVLSGKTLLHESR